MLPVRVKVVSTSSCSLSQASSLLQRFLSDGACCDSLARDYAANAAKALQDSISKRAGESKDPFCIPSSSPQVPSHRSKESAVEKKRISAAGQLAFSSADRKRHGHEKPRLQTVFYEDGNSGSVDDKAADSVNVESERFHKRHKKKRRHSALENGLEMVSPLMQEPDQSPVKQQDKKRRKKKEGRKETDHNAIEITSEIHCIEEEEEREEELPVNAESFSSEKKKRRKKKKKRKEKLESD